MTHSPQVRRILLAKGVRAFGDGFVSVLLPLYLLELGLGPLQVGIIATATLLGSGMLTLAVGMRAHRFACRTLLLAATALMAATGLGFAFVTAFWPLLVIAIVGTLNPSSGDVSVFLPLEHALLSRLVGDRAANGGIRALQPRRLARRRGGLAGRRSARDDRRARGALDARVDPGDVRRLRRARRAGGDRVSRLAGDRRIGGPARRRAATRIEEARLRRSPRSSASMHSAAASSCSRWSRCGSTSASDCRSPQPARSSSGRAS